MYNKKFIFNRIALKIDIVLQTETNFKAFFSKKTQNKFAEMEILRNFATVL